MTIGLRFLLSSLVPGTSVSGFSLLAYAPTWLGEGKGVRENGIIILITMALLIGYFKGKFLLSKSALREINRVTLLSEPTSIKNIYSMRYYLIIALMMVLGSVMRFLPITSDTRGFIDVTIGMALINGSRSFYRRFFRSLLGQVLPSKDNE